jgi:hypothetical protein
MGKAWNQKHPEETRRARLKWEQKNTEKISSRMKLWHKNHPDYRRKYAKKWKKQNPGYKQAYMKSWKERYPERYAKAMREDAWKQLGIDMKLWSYEHYLQMLKDQKGSCRGCGKGMVAIKPPGSTGFSVAHVDHNHITGKVRCLLCRECNTALGLLCDNTNTLKNLAAMLEAEEK